MEHGDGPHVLAELRPGCLNLAHDKGNDKTILIEPV